MLHRDNISEKFKLKAESTRVAYCHRYLVFTLKEVNFCYTIECMRQYQIYSSADLFRSHIYSIYQFNFIDLIKSPLLVEVALLACLA